MRIRLIFLAGVAALYLSVFLFLDNLQFAIGGNDEAHFWPTVQSFSEPWPPSLERLRTYGELSTPLPFVVFGALEHYLQRGIFAGRLLNFLMSYAMIALIALAGPDAKRAIRAACGLLLFPYFLGVSTHLYTDTIAAFFVLFGLHLHMCGRPTAGGFSFVLAIASRQYMVAFPMAVATAEVMQDGDAPPWRRARVLAPAAAAATLGLWYAFFGGFGPPQEIARQQVSTAVLQRVYPQYALYFLACLGVYFVLPETLLFRRSPFRACAPPMRGVAVALGLAAAFVFFPPLANIDYPIARMGYLDTIAAWFLGGPLRMILYYGCALAACLRFRPIHLAFMIIVANALVLTKAHLAWDKYALATLATLWFMVAKDAEGRRPAPRGATACEVEPPV